MGEVGGKSIAGRGSRVAGWGDGPKPWVLEGAEQGGGTSNEAAEEGGGLPGDGPKSSLQGSMGAVEVPTDGFTMQSGDLLNDRTRGPRGAEEPLASSGGNDLSNCRPCRTQHPPCSSLAQVGNDIEAHTSKEGPCGPLPSTLC